MPLNCSIEFFHFSFYIFKSRISFWFLFSRFYWCFHFVHTSFSWFHIYSSLSICKTVVLRSLCIRYATRSFSETVSAGLFFPLIKTYFSVSLYAFCFFVCFVIFLLLLKTEYLNLISNTTLGNQILPHFSVFSFCFIFLDCYRLGRCCRLAWGIILRFFKDFMSLHISLGLHSDFVIFPIYAVTLDVLVFTVCPTKEEVEIN